MAKICLLNTFLTYFFTKGIGHTGCLLPEVLLTCCALVHPINIGHPHNPVNFFFFFLYLPGPKTVVFNLEVTLAVLLLLAAVVCFISNCSL